MSQTRAASDCVLEARALHKQYGKGKLAVQVLQNLHLCVRPGQAVAIVGVSGSGKSTLLHLLAGLDTPSSGQIVLQGRDFARMSVREQGLWRNAHMGFVYQFHHLLPEFSALENVAMPLLLRRMPHAQALGQAGAMLSQVGLEKRQTHRPDELSGGERQRVAIARALVAKPACVLADEPTGNLDRGNADTVFDLMRALAQAHGTALVLVTHDRDVAQRCDVVWHLQQGQLHPDHS